MITKSLKLLIGILNKRWLIVKSMSTELDVLKKISENKGKAPIQLIAKQLKMGNDYARYLCRDLLKKGLVKKFKKKDWYKITRRGQKEIGKTEKSMKKYKKKTKKRLKRKVKTLRKLRSRKKKVAKVFPQKIRKATIKKEAIPSKKKSKKIIKTILKVLKNLFRLKKG